MWNIRRAYAAVIFTFFVVDLPVFGFTVMVTEHVPLPTIFTLDPLITQIFFDDEDVIVVFAPEGAEKPVDLRRLDDDVDLPTFDTTTPLEVVVEVELEEDPLELELLELLEEPLEAGNVVDVVAGAALVVSAIRLDE